MTVSLKKQTDEQWKVIPGYEKYEACDFGFIRNAQTRRILKPTLGGPKRKSYLRVYVGGGRKSSKKPLHILVLTAFRPQQNKRYFALHKDDDQFNNHLDNLYWGTPSDNNKDCVKNGSHKPMRGITNGMAKFSNELIENIRSEFTGKRGEQTILARKYNMSISNVNYIVRGETRKNG